MRLTPTYGVAAPLSIEGDAADQALPVSRQRRRLLELLATLDDEQWRAPTRCAGWSVQDVAAHLVSVDSFWAASVRAGSAGTPSEVLANFDPAAHPPLLIEPLRARPPAAVLEQLTAATEAFLDALASLDDAGWNALGESPAGHVSIRLLAFHALWDCWVHERDIALPLGLTSPVEPDEVISCLQYAAALGPFLARAWPASERAVGMFGVQTTAPEHTMTITVGDGVTVANASPPAGAPCLRGDAAAIVDVLSVRTPLPPDAPTEWHHLVRGLATVFDQ